jgi:hypothetical protein
MRTRTFVVATLAAAVLMSAAAIPAAAQPRLDARPVRLVINLGYVNILSQPKWVNFGPELEVRLGRLFSLNPDVSIWFGQSFERKVQVVPGAMLNLRLGRFFVGAGAVRRIPDWPENPTFAEVDRGWLLPKAQVGYLSGPARVTLSMLFVNAADDVAVGLTIGMSIGRPSRGED